MIRKSLLYNLCCTVYFFLFLSQSSLAKNCLNISVTQIIPLPEISGASGIEYIDGFYYISALKYFKNGKLELIMGIFERNIKIF